MTQTLAYPIEERSEHIGGKRTRLGVPRAWMVRPEDLATIGEVDLESVCKLRNLRREEIVLFQ
jgi:hypothetical protein